MTAMPWPARRLRRRGRCPAIPPKPKNNQRLRWIFRASSAARINSSWKGAPERRLSNGHKPPLSTERYSASSPIISTTDYDSRTLKHRRASQKRPTQQSKRCECSHNRTGTARESISPKLGLPALSPTSSVSKQWLHAPSPKGENAKRDFWSLEQSSLKAARCRTLGSWRKLKKHSKKPGKCTPLQATVGTRRMR